VTNIEKSVAVVRDRIIAACERSGRHPDDVKLIAVTKRVDTERIREAAALGITDIGENYVQEAKKKREAVGLDLKWHMIGHLQVNKAKYIPALFDCVHSIDRWELLEHLDRYGKELPVLFEVNLSGEPQKHGTTREGLRAMLGKTANLRFLKPVGLMAMAPFTAQPEEARPVFRALHQLLDEVNREFGLRMKELSMGMSTDFETAIEEGATMVRIGTAIFGERT
jgi:hypothetical protein